MNIDCPNCQKKFNVNDNLIPKKGRQIQCGACNHIWFYKGTKEIEKINNDNVDFNIDNNTNKRVKKTTYIDNNNFTNRPNLRKKIKNNPVSKFFSYLLVIIISFMALIIFLDSFKTYLIAIFPSIEIILFNLFETFKDIKLFIIDLT